VESKSAGCVQHATTNQVGAAALVVFLLPSKGSCLSPLLLLALRSLRRRTKWRRWVERRGAAVSIAVSLEAPAGLMAGQCCSPWRRPHLHYRPTKRQRVGGRRDVCEQTWPWENTAGCFWSGRQAKVGRFAQQRPFLGVCDVTHASVARRKPD
jgi:hypothetical protein